MGQPFFGCPSHTRQRDHQEVRSESEGRTHLNPHVISPLLVQCEHISISEGDVVDLNQPNAKSMADLDVDSTAHAQCEVDVGVEAIELSLYSAHQEVCKSLDSISACRHSRAKQKVESMEGYVSSGNVEGFFVIAEVADHAEVFCEVGSSAETHSMHPFALLENGIPTRIERVVDVDIVAEMRIPDEYLTSRIIALGASRDCCRHCQSNKHENSLHGKPSLLVL